MLEVTEKVGELEIVGSYNRSKLKQSKMFELFNQYMKLLQVLTESDKCSSDRVEI